jgi:hypothetical protein
VCVLTVDENCALLGHDAASTANSFPTFRDNLSVSSSGVNGSRLTPEGGIDRLSRNVGRQLPVLDRNKPEELSSLLR